MRQFIIISSVLIFTCLSVYSQEPRFDDSTLLDDFDNIKNQFDDEFKTFKEKSDQEMADFKNEADREFAGYLKNKWFKYNLSKEDSFFIIKPVEKAPVYQNKEANKKQVTSISIVNSAEKVENFVKLKPVVSADKTNATAFDFYGKSIIITYDDDLLPSISLPIDENAISKSWSMMVKSHYEKVVNQLITYKINLFLNDYAYLQLIRKFSSQINRDHNNANLLSWILLNKSGFKAKIGYADSICLLVPFRQMVYNNKYLIVENEKYYLLDKSDNNLKTYVNEDKDARLEMDLNISNNLRFGDNIVERELSVSPQLPILKLNVNKNLVDFYASYPQTDISVYLDAVIDESLLKQVRAYFAPILKDKNELDGINTILNFCQKLTAYKEDFESFGKEKFMFAEESFFYPFSDCEDRTILFAKLLYELIGKYCVGLQYKGHMAGAVAIDPFAAKGSVIDNKYLICDPTYIDAPAGFVIPEYENQNPVIILPDTNLVSENKRLQIAEFLKNHDVNITDNRNSLSFDNNGNCYFIGSFKDNLKFGRYTFTTLNDSNNVILGKLDRKKNVIWCNQIGGKGNYKGFCITLLNTDIIVAFSYTDSANVGSMKLYSKYRDYCISKIDYNGNYIWTVPLKVKNYNLSGNDYLQCSIANDGSINWAKPENNALIEQSYSLYSGNNSIIFMAPSDKMNFENSDLNYSSFDLFELPGQIISEYQRLIKLSFDSTAATIYVIGNLMQKNGSIMSGRAFQTALNKSNPDFKNKNPLFYTALANILIIRNNNNKIVVSTKGGEKVTLNKLLIENGAVFSMFFLPNGNLKIDVEKGIKANVFDLNYAVVSKKEGTIMLDFSKDHQQKALKIKPEIVQ